MLNDEWEKAALPDEVGEDTPYAGNRFDERKFQDWYGRWSGAAGLDPDPDNPEHHYDYRAAFLADATPDWDEQSASYHWPSQFKADDHPNRYIDNIDTKTGFNLQSAWDESDPEAESDGSFLGGVGVLLQRAPSIVVDYVPETTGRALRGGRKTLEESWLDLWIEKNRLEGERSKKLTKEEKGKTWFTMPFTGQKVTYGDAEEAAESIAYSVANMIGTVAGGMITGGAGGAAAGFVYPPAMPATAAAGAVIGGIATGTIFSGEASKDQFIDQFFTAFRKSRPENTPENERLWGEIYKKIEQDADWYGFWEAAPETVGNILTMGIAGMGKGLLKAGEKGGALAFMPELKKKVAQAVGESIAAKLGIPVAKAGAMLTEEMLTEALTTKKQSEIEAKHGLRERPATFAEALVEVAPMTLINTAVMGAGAAGATSAASKFKDKRVEGRLNEVIESWIKDIEANIQAGTISPEDIKQMVSEMREGNPVRERLQKLMGGQPEAKGAEPVSAPIPSPATEQDIVNLKNYLLTGFKDESTFSVKPAAENQETAKIRQVSNSLGLKTVFFEGEGVASGLNGAYDPSSGTIFVNAKTDKPYLVILGHETVHRLHTEHPDLWQRLNDLTKDFREDFEGHLKVENAGRKRLGLAEITPDQALGQYEYMADFVGQQFANPKFWEKLNEKDPALGRQIAQILVELIEKIRATLRGQKITDAKYYKQLNDVQDALAATYAEFIRREKKVKDATVQPVAAPQAPAGRQPAGLPTRQPSAPPTAADFEEAEPVAAEPSGPPARPPQKPAASPKPKAPSAAQPKVTTLRGRIKKMQGGGIRVLNFKGEFKEVPTAVKFLLKKAGEPIDLAERMLKDEGWLREEESLIDVLRDPANLRRNKVVGEGSEKRPEDMTELEKQIQKDMEHEPEAPPEGDYVMLEADELPEGKKLTIIDDSPEGWDVYEVTEKDPFGVTLKDGRTVELKPGQKVQVRKEDLGAKAPAPEEAKRPPEQEPEEKPEPPGITPSENQEMSPQQTGATRQLANWVLDRLKKKQAFDWRELFEAADKRFGGSQAQGRYSVKDAYDGMELGVNFYLEHSFLTLNPTVDAKAAQKIVTALKGMLELLPTQTKRTQEQQEFQQFSTPPPLAYIVNWVLNLKPEDVFLEPSAGTGGIAVFALDTVEEVYVNELSPRRAAILGYFDFKRVFIEDGEQLNNVLPKNLRPTVIGMNPPFSATAGRTSRNKTKYGARHIEQALLRLAPGGRLVAIVGKGMADSAPAFKEWWKDIKARHNVLANISIAGAEYAKYGTSFDNQILVIDKAGPTQYDTLTGHVVKLEELIPLLEGVRNARSKTSTDQGSKQPAILPTRPEAAPEGEVSGGPSGALPGPAADLGAGQPEARHGQRPSGPAGIPTGNAGGTGGLPSQAGGFDTPQRPGVDRPGSRGRTEGPDAGDQAGGGVDDIINGLLELSANEAEKAAEASQEPEEKPAPAQAPEAAKPSPPIIKPGSTPSQENVAKTKAKEGQAKIDGAIKKFNDLFASIAKEDAKSAAAEAGIDPARWPAVHEALKEMWAGFKEIVSDIEEAAKLFIKDAYTKLSAKGRAYIDKFIREDIRGELEKERLVKEQTTPPKEIDYTDQGKNKLDSQQEIEDALFDDYKPRVAIPGARKHPAKLVQSVAMADTELPPPTYKTLIPKRLIESGNISDAQLEAVIYSNQSFEKILPDGRRRGFFIGDGTGVGKGREIASIIYENYLRGRKKAVWVSEKPDLMKDARRDLYGEQVGEESGKTRVTGIGWREGAKMLFTAPNPKPPKRQPGQPKPAKREKFPLPKITRNEGILFASYASLRGGFKELREDVPETLKDMRARIIQMVDWLGQDFDGVIAF